MDSPFLNIAIAILTSHRRVGRSPKPSIHSLHCTKCTLKRSARIKMIIFSSFIPYIKKSSNAKTGSALIYIPAPRGAILRTYATWFCLMTTAIHPRTYLNKRVRDMDRKMDRKSEKKTYRNRFMVDRVRDRLTFNLIHWGFSTWWYLSRSISFFLLPNVCLLIVESIIEPGSWCLKRGLKSIRGCPL